MEGVRKVTEYLNNQQIAYQILEHRLAFSASETAAAQHVPGREQLKAVIVSADGKFIMCVLSATYRIDFNRLKKVVGASELFLAQESELEKLFPGYELGAEPPFGQLYNMPVYIDDVIAENEEITFNAGTHTCTIRMKYRDFAHLVKPIAADFGVHI